MHTLLKGRERNVSIHTDGPLVLVGDRINPSRRKRLSESLLEGDLSLVRQEALAQTEAGAQVIDVNVSAIGISEEEALPAVVQAVAETTAGPVCIDTTNLQALADALAVCPGKPLVNSVTGEEASLESVLPLVKQHSCAVIGLCMDEGGVPRDAEGRLRIAQRILERAQRHGIAREDVVIDPLATTVGADHAAAKVTFDAINLVREGLGTSIVLGVGNISFGMPERHLMNRTFLAMAVTAGLSCAIADPLDVEIRRTIAACDLLLGYDEYAARFLEQHRGGW